MCLETGELEGGFAVCVCWGNTSTPSAYYYIFPWDVLGWVHGLTRGVPSHQQRMQASHPFPALFYPLPSHSPIPSVPGYYFLLDLTCGQRKSEQRYSISIWNPKNEWSKERAIFISEFALKNSIFKNRTALYLRFVSTAWLEIGKVLTQYDKAFVPFFLRLPKHLDLVKVLYRIRVLCWRNSSAVGKSFEHNGDTWSCSTFYVSDKASSVSPFPLFSTFLWTRKLHAPLQLSVVVPWRVWKLIGGFGLQDQVA